ncbi:hypothetical protein BDR05DRAFT_775522 [Suillus weaverae]|nr:hypothetical protein BDR05DRAFT_775522 [Suillus weaverae]
MHLFNLLGISMKFARPQYFHGSVSTGNPDLARLPVQHNCTTHPVHRAPMYLPRTQVMYLGCAIWLANAFEPSPCTLLIVRLGQPFSAFLLAQQRSGEYKRIASDRNIITQVRDVDYVRGMDIRTLEIL